MQSPSKNLNNQVRVLIWPSKKIDTTSIDKRGHVEIFVSDKCYGFFPAPNSEPRDLIRGCKGDLVLRPLVDVAAEYFQRVRRQNKEDVIDSIKYDKLPTIWSFTFKISNENVQKIVVFFKSVKKKPPLYAYRANLPNSHNCQTISKKALSISGILKESSLDSVRPDDLLGFLQRKNPGIPELVKVEKLQLKPPRFI